MFEIISALIPFFLLGIVAAGLSRVSGVALSMIIVPTLLIWGANAIDVIAFMLLFVVYNNFTMETQDVRLDYKDLVLFPKWRLCIPFILSLIFAFIYYFMREQTEKGKWIGFKEKLAIYLGTPVLMLAMGALNYVRDNAQVSHSGVFDLLLDFIYKQGTSFGVLARGFLYNSSLPYRDFRNFTFGPVVDYFARGSIGIIFGAKPFEHTTDFSTSRNWISPDFA